MLIMSWVSAICSGQKVGAYLSDISCAFVRAFQILLLAKIYDFEVDSIYPNFLESYPAPSKGILVMEDVSSEAIA